MQSSGNIGHERMLNNNNNSSSSSSNNNPKNMKSKKKIERKKKKLSKWFRMSRGNEPFVTSEHLQCRPKTETRHNTKEWRIIIIIMIKTIIIMEAFSALWPFAAAVTSLSFFFFVECSCHFSFDDSFQLETTPPSPPSPPSPARPYNSPVQFQL